MSFRMQENADGVRAAYAVSLFAFIHCTPLERNADALPPGIVIPYALELAMGADPDTALPHLAFSLDEGSAPDSSLSEDEVKKALNIFTTQDAVRVAQAWFENQQACRGR